MVMAVCCLLDEALFRLSLAVSAVLYTAATAERCSA
jgi:hypothetical protein